MTDEQFRQLCNTFGFAPSRALRELIDCATARAEAQRNALLEALKLIVQWDEAGLILLDHHIERARAAIKQAEGETR